MNKVNLVVSSNKAYDNIVLVDGKRFKYKKNKNKDMVGVIETNNDKVEIEIFNWFEIKSKLWLIMELFFFVISIFGLFDVKKDKKGKKVNFKAVFKLKEDNNIRLSYGPLKDNVAPIRIDSNLDMEVIENKFIVDEVVVKRYKLLKLFKFLTFILIVGIAVLLLV